MRLAIETVYLDANTILLTTERDCHTSEEKNYLTGHLKNYFTELVERLAYVKQWITI